MFQYDHHDPARSMHEREIRRAFRAHRREPRGEFRAEFGRGAGPGAGPGFGGHGAHRGWWRLGFIGGGPRVRRGDVRSAILALLAEEPMHGYQIINELETRSGGRWRPSAGSVYPTLQQLEDEGLVRAEERDGRRVFTLTEAGRTAAASSTAARRKDAPWDAADDERATMRDLLFQVAAATMQVAQVGSPELTVEARKILTETRRSLYRLLAEDDGQAGPTTDSTAAPEAAEAADATDPATAADSTEPIA
ncbi:MAG: PadR family transcriptional regulator [Candidatus Limnocylindrales bacterium]